MAAEPEEIERADGFVGAGRADFAGCWQGAAESVGRDPGVGAEVGWGLRLHRVGTDESQGQY